MAGTDPQEQPSGTRESVSVLAGRLACDLAVLVRVGLEEVATRGSENLRAVTVEVVALAAAGSRSCSVSVVYLWRWCLRSKRGCDRGRPLCWSEAAGC